MSFFKNTVEIMYETKVITNPENQLIVNYRTIQLGTKYILLRTVWNWIKHATCSLFQR